MPLASVASVDTAGGGVIAGGSQTIARFQGNLLAVVGDSIAAHGIGPHAAANIAAGSAAVTISGLSVARAGDAATCGDLVTGSSTLNVAS